eukprot:12176129-Ditylum_brightwellii.AAC.1
MEEEAQIGEAFRCLYVYRDIVTLQPCLMQAEEIGGVVCKLVAHLLKLLVIVSSDATSIETKTTKCSKFTGAWPEGRKTMDAK